MYQPIQIKTTTRNATSHLASRDLLLIPLAFICLGLLPAVRAVVPQPDGTYANFNVAEGFNALLSLTTGTSNTAIGFAALASNTTGNHNTAFGLNTMLFNTTGNFNMGIGGGCLRNNLVGNNNTAIGFQAMSANTASDNSAIGYQALFKNTTGYYNTANGGLALYNNTTGAVNIALGQYAGGSLTTGSFNIDIGNAGIAGESATIRIGSAQQLATYIAGIHGATASGGTAVYANSSGRLGTLTSSARFKQDIQAMGESSDVLLSLRPVTFRYKPEIDPKGLAQFGLVAEEVAKVDPALVSRDAEGEPYTVRYEAVNAMLLNEFIKEHSKVEKLEATVASLMAMVTEQAAQIQKVSARLEAGKPALQVAANQ